MPQHMKMRSKTGHGGERIYEHADALIAREQCRECVASKGRAMMKKRRHRERILSALVPKAIKSNTTSISTSENVRTRTRTRTHSGMMVLRPTS